MLSEGGVNHAHIEENLGCIGNWLEVLQCLVELVVVVPREGGDPTFYFLERCQQVQSSRAMRDHDKPVLETCLLRAHFVSCEGEE